ncbi:hypothetical protein ASF43_23375 [Pseudorhodoferax sp. Leaf267]|nr:hypothetical protein ASF43_23375 [Pseudorhodoferax sp. Leaf267]
MPEPSVHLDSAFKPDAIHLQVHQVVPRVPPRFLSVRVNRAGQKPEELWWAQAALVMLMTEELQFCARVDDVLSFGRIREP